MKQVVLPKSLRGYVMSVAHDSISRALIGITEKGAKQLLLAKVGRRCDKILPVLLSFSANAALDNQPITLGLQGGTAGVNSLELFCGRTKRGPLHILRELWSKEIQEPDVQSTYEYVLNIRDRLDHILEIARENMQEAYIMHKYFYDRTAGRRKFSVGNKMLILLPTESNNLLVQSKRLFDIFGDSDEVYKERDR
ncbi:reverse transcriptase [Plakobranchus ocellatus]|uniref:Reverse transcriptase n=1 Tax=Plakobranchus ocellatus TaxID=259542 RepID=A0AAV4CZ11_9GAST|nr:reverse transcriptase [Plakobranchus ocellatus]